MEKEKAEAYVREKLPELMELSFGCAIHINHASLASSIVGSSLYPDVTVLTETTEKDNYVVKTFGGTNYLTWIQIDRHCEIIGHPIQLQHWLRVLGEKSNMWAMGLDGNVFGQSSSDGSPIWSDLNFNLTTGQPATEADYKAFNDIVKN